jgi:hypothetical protein
LSAQPKVTVEEIEAAAVAGEGGSGCFILTVQVQDASLVELIPILLAGICLVLFLFGRRNTRVEKRQGWGD